MVTTRLGWQLLRDADQARDFAEALRALRRSSRDRPTQNRGFTANIQDFV